MFTFEHISGLPYAVSGDTVEIIVSNGLISFTHHGLDESERLGRAHGGQYHPWRLLLVARDIKRMQIKVIPEPGGLLSRLFGVGFRGASVSRSAYLELEAQIGESHIAVVLKGDFQASQSLKGRVLNANLYFDSSELNAYSSW